MISSLVRIVGDPRQREQRLIGQSRKPGFKRLAQRDDVAARVILIGRRVRRQLAWLGIGLLMLDDGPTDCAVAETAGTVSIRMINANLTIGTFPLARMTKVSFHHNRAYRLLM